MDTHKIDLTTPVDTPDVSEIEETPKSSTWWSMVSETLETLVLAAIMVLVINTVSARIRVDGVSMQPSFYQNEFVIVNKLAYKFGDIERGDVVVFPYPNNPEDDYIKRVIGLSGDHVEMLDGSVYVNGVRLDEPYIAEGARQNYVIDVPDGTLFLVGDNRNSSSDSRVWGTLPVEDVIGKAVFTYWPVTAFGPVMHYDQDSAVESAQ